MPSIHVRPLKSLEEFHACENIQLSVWGNLAVGSELMSVTARYGGAVIGALAGGNVIGFIYAFMARRHGRLVHWSHMMAVEPQFRDRGLGFRMKQVHWRLALEQGITSICWTYDPLQSRNAFLNIHRLGGTVDEYIENCYGQFPSRIEKGLASDRFVVDWRIASKAVKKNMAANRSNPVNTTSLPRANATRTNAHGLLDNRALRLNLSTPRIAVQIPANTDAMRAKDIRLAERWRLQTRRIFSAYLRRGYRVTDFATSKNQSGYECFYILGRSNKQS